MGCQRGGTMADYAHLITLDPKDFGPSVASEALSKLHRINNGLLSYWLPQIIYLKVCKYRYAPWLYSWWPIIIRLDWHNISWSTFYHRTLQMFKILNSAVCSGTFFKCGWSGLK